MTIALRAATAELRSLTLVCLGVTAALGIVFLVCKGLEYREDLKEHLFPGPIFPLSPPATQIFWGLYWVMTGVHAVHLSVGIGVVLLSLFFSVGGSFRCRVRQWRAWPSTGTSSIRSGSYSTRSSTLEADRERQPVVVSPSCESQAWRRSIWQLAKVPSLAWLALMALFVANFLLAYLPLGSRQSCA